MKLYIIIIKWVSMKGRRSELRSCVRVEVDVKA